MERNIMIAYKENNLYVFWNLRIDISIIYGLTRGENND